VGEERVEEVIDHYCHTNHCTFLIKTWPHVEFASSRDIKDGDFSQLRAKAEEGFQKFLLNWLYTTAGVCEPSHYFPVARERAA